MTNPRGDGTRKQVAIGESPTLSVVRKFILWCKSLLGTNKIHWILFFLILCVGIFARIWEFGRLPPGLNADEASIGVDAFSLLHYGMDRNGVSFPMQFISWGSGQNALYGYLLIPVIALLGLTPTAVRLPMLVSGILSLPLVYLVGKETFDQRFGLLSMFFLAISPWHILLSRWGLESNIFPFVFLAGYVCLIYTRKNRILFIIACFIFGLALYAYGTSYAMVPLFLIGAALIVARSKILPGKTLFAGLLIFLVTAIPIGLFIFVNLFGWNSIRLGPVTVPRLPVQARYQSETLLSQGNPWPGAAENLWATLRLLFTQSDGLIYNEVDPYGYFYGFTLPLAAIGIVILTMGKKGSNRPAHLLLLAWLGGSMVVGILQPANINRLNIIFIPLILCVAVCLVWLNTQVKYALSVSIGILMLGFVFFSFSYHGPEYRQQIDFKFHVGLLPTLAFARQVGNGPICMTDQINMPYIFALFAEQLNPASFLSTVVYADPQAPLREVLSFGRYTFGIKSCTSTPPPIYVAASGETPSHLGNKYKYEFFGDYAVYYPKP